MTLPCSGKSNHPAQPHGSHIKWLDSQQQATGWAMCLVSQVITSCNLSCAILFAGSSSPTAINYSRWLLHQKFCLKIHLIEVKGLDVHKDQAQDKRELWVQTTVFHFSFHPWKSNLYCFFQGHKKDHGRSKNRTSLSYIPSYLHSKPSTIIESNKWMITGLNCICFY